MIRYFRQASLFFLCVLPVFLFAQEKKITGKVVDPDGLPLIAANILIVETEEEFLTDYKGDYALNATEGQHLMFSYTGYQSQTVTVRESNRIDIILSEGTQLDEKASVVFGLSRELRSLAYPIEGLTVRELENIGKNDLPNILQGKINGGITAPDGAGPGQSAHLLFRGIQTFGKNPGNEPLFVLDGLPVDASLHFAGGDPGRNFSGRISDLEPQDIESISILKGGAATALYGIRGSNGAVLMTSKKGGEGFQLRLSSTFSTEHINKYPENQKIFAQGYLGIYNGGSIWPGWGSSVEEARKENPSHPDHLFNNFENACRSGQRWQNTLTLSGGEENTGYRISLSNLNQKGIIPGSDYDRFSGRVTGFFQPAEPLYLAGGISFIHSGGDLVNASRFNEELSYWAPGADVREDRFPDGTMKGDRYGGRQGNNPIFGAETNRYSDKINRYAGHFSLRYEMTDWLDVLYQIGFDRYDDFRFYRAPGPQGLDRENIYDLNGKGFAAETTIEGQNLNSNLVLNFTRNFSEKVSTDFFLGFDFLNHQYDRHTVRGSDLSIWNAPKLENTDPSTITRTEASFSRRTFGVFGELMLNYDKTFYLSLSNRADHSKKYLHQDHGLFFSPSAGLSYIFTEHFQPFHGLIDIGKIRVSYALSGEDTYPYRRGEIYQPVDFGGLSNREIQVADDLSPEKVSVYEAGIDLEALGGRIGLDMTYFRHHRKGVILPVKGLAPGESDLIFNAADILHRGMEIGLDLNPILSEKTFWNIRLNFSSPRSKVTKIRDGAEEIVLASESGFNGSSASLRLVAGEKFGNIYGTSYSRYQNGGSDGTDLHGPLLIGSDGFPVKNGNPLILGNIFPDWTGSLSTRFSFRNIEFSALMDTWQGYQRYNHADHYMSWYGVAEYTADRNNMVVFDGVTTEGLANTKSVFKGQGIGPDGKDYTNGFYQKTYSGITENFVEDAHWIRLRDISFGYHLPEKQMEKWLVSDVKISVNAHNLWMSTPYSGFDPENGLFNYGRGEDIFGSFVYPSVKSYSLSLRITL